MLVPPALAHMAAPQAGAPTAPPSVTAARALPDFDAPHGWRAAIGKEIARVEGFRAWRLATAEEVREDRRLYGDARVSIGYVVAVLTCKLDPAGGPRSQEVLNKFRVAIADKADAAAGVITHSNCADEISNRLITAICGVFGAALFAADRPSFSGTGQGQGRFAVGGWLCILPAKRRKALIFLM
jgi:hypothetical protein